MGRSVSVLSFDVELIECDLKKKGGGGLLQKTRREEIYVYWKCKSMVTKMEEQSRLMRVNRQLFVLSHSIGYPP